MQCEGGDLLNDAMLSEVAGEPNHEIGPTTELHQADGRGHSDVAERVHQRLQGCQVAKHSDGLVTRTLEKHAQSQPLTCSVLPEEEVQSQRHALATAVTALWVQHQCLLICQYCQSKEHHHHRRYLTARGPPLHNIVVYPTKTADYITGNITCTAN